MIRNLDELDESASLLGAGNYLVIKDGKLIGIKYGNGVDVDPAVMRVALEEVFS